MEAAGTVCYPTRLFLGLLLAINGYLPPDVETRSEGWWYHSGGGCSRGVDGDHMPAAIIASHHFASGTRFRMKEAS